MSEREQLGMFDADEVLPLWTGTAPRGQVEVFGPSPVARQLGFACPICKGVGWVVVDGKRVRCTCGVEREEQNAGDTDGVSRGDCAGG